MSVIYLFKIIYSFIVLYLLRYIKKICFTIKKLSKKFFKYYTKKSLATVGFEPTIFCLLANALPTAPCRLFNYKLN